MDKRLILAVFLTALVVVLTPMLFSSGKKSQSRVATPRDSSTVTASSDSIGRIGVPSPPTVVRTDSNALQKSLTLPLLDDTVRVLTSKAQYLFSGTGAALWNVNLNEYKTLGKSRRGSVQLGRLRAPLLSYTVATEHDTVPLASYHFRVDTSGLHQPHPQLKFTSASSSLVGELIYTFAPDSYIVRIAGRVNVVGGGKSNLLLRLSDGLRSGEADSVDDQHHLAYVVKPRHDNAESTPFSKLAKLDSTVTQFESGPFSWVASKNKYFLVVALADSTQPFQSVAFPGNPTVRRSEAIATADISQPLATGGSFQFELYTGPQEFRRLLAIGHDLQDVNPYGGILRGVVQPFAYLVMRVLLWMHDTLRLSYGWVLVAFGIAVRLILWPLNQSAMRTSMRMQRIQPELTAIQKRYKNQPEKQQAEIFKLYKEHGMSPFSPLSGCLPMLLPMPVLFALFFVFRETIEFRGVPFLWLPDISQKDPYYLIPVFMGISMYLLSWIGLRNSPPNPQAKTMAYMFPVVMTVAFVNLASGLNLYYAVQNIAALPQQWLIARERAKAAPKLTG